MIAQIGPRRPPFQTSKISATAMKLPSCGGELAKGINQSKNRFEADELTKRKTLTSIDESQCIAWLIASGHYLTAQRLKSVF
jgi:hypothetical protein